MLHVIDPRRERLLWLLLLLPVFMLLFFWNELPDKVPLHWNLRGEVDGYGPKWVLPLINIGTYALLTLLPRIDPRRENYPRFQRSFFFIRLIMVLFLVGLSVLTYLIALGVPLHVPHLIPILMLLLLAALGNYMTAVKPNWFIGIRTPWTLENEEVWRKTHRFGGRLWFFGGLSGAALLLLLPPALHLAVLIGAITVLTLLPLAYSYWVYRRLDKDELV